MCARHRAAGVRPLAQGEPVQPDRPHLRPTCQQPCHARCGLEVSISATNQETQMEALYVYGAGP